MKRWVSLLVVGLVGCGSSPPAHPLSLASERPSTRPALSEPGALGSPASPAPKARRGLAAAERGFLACFGLLRQGNPSATGRVTLAAQIDRQGVVTGVRPEGEGALGPMFGCLAAVLENTPFAPTAAPASVRIPVFFSAKGLAFVGAPMPGPDPSGLSNLDGCVRGGATTTPKPPPSIHDAAEVVEAMRGEFRRCYQSLLSEDRHAEGSVWLQARVNSTGSVDEVLYYTQPDLLGAVPCLRGTVASATFAPPAGGQATVCIPITFVKK